LIDVHAQPLNASVAFHRRIAIDGIALREKSDQWLVEVPFVNIWAHTPDLFGEAQQHHPAHLVHGLLKHLAEDPTSPIVAAADSAGLLLRVGVVAHKRLEVEIEGERIRLQECFSDRSAITLEVCHASEDEPVWSEAMHVYPACGLSEQHPAELTVLARCFKGALPGELLAASFAVLTASRLGLHRRQPALVVGASADSKEEFLGQLRALVTEFRGTRTCRLEDDILPAATTVTRSMPRAEAWRALLELLGLRPEEVPIDGAKFKSRSYSYWQTPLQMSKASARLDDSDNDLD
jgi:hypothetical protein